MKKGTTRNRGDRTPLSPGYIWGRSDGGGGDSHPIKVGAGLALRNRELVAVSSGSGAAGDWNGFGFSFTNLFSDKELLGIGIFPVPMTFPSAAASHVPAIKSILPAVNNSSLTIVPVVGGLDQPAVGSIDFLAGGTDGTVTWTPASYILPANTPFKLYAPSPPDPGLAFLTGFVPGDL